MQATLALPYNFTSLWGKFSIVSEKLPLMPLSTCHYTVTEINISSF